MRMDRTRRVTIRAGFRFSWCVLSLLCLGDGLWESSALTDGSLPLTIDAPGGGLQNDASRPQQALERRAPEKAYALVETLKQRHGQPLSGYVGGRPFHNRELRLPLGRYKEYDVNRKVPGRSRDAERIVIEQTTGKAYYTDDHYRTFLPLN
jgi:ribonuclease T1